MLSEKFHNFGREIDFPDRGSGLAFPNMNQGVDEIHVGPGQRREARPPASPYRARP